MFLFLFADEYIGAKGGWTRLTRHLNDDFKPQEIQQDNEHDNFVGSVQAGYMKRFKYVLFALEVFVHKPFNNQKTYFEKDFGIGPKAFIGVNLGNYLSVFAGGGIEFSSIRSLKAMKNGGMLSFYQKSTKDHKPEQALDFTWDYNVLATGGILYAIDTSWSFCVEITYLFTKSRVFQKETVLKTNDLSTPVIINATSNSSTESYNNIQISLGLTYLGGFL